MNYTLFDPTFLEYDRNTIKDLCDYYTNNNRWDLIYPGVNLDSKRGSKDFLETDGKKIIESFNPELNITYKNAQIFRMKPNDLGVIHKDTDRTCGILFPITPIGENFAPIIFYDKDKNEIEKLNYSDQAIILNVLEYHNVNNNNYERINFQIDLNLEYSKVVELYKNNNLFK